MAQAYVEADDFAGLRVDAKDRGAAVGLGGLRIGVDDPTLWDELMDDKDGLGGGDVLHHVFLFADGDPTAMHLIAFYGFFHVPGMIDRFEVTEDWVVAEVRFFRRGGQRWVGEQAAGLIDVEFFEGGVGDAVRELLLGSDGGERP